MQEVCSSVGVKNLKNVWWNDVVKTEVYRKEVTWEEVLGVRDEVAKIDIWVIPYETYQ